MFVDAFQRPIVQAEGFVTVGIRPMLENALRLEYLPASQQFGAGYVLTQGDERLALQTVLLR
jgi:hypothetical protein